MNSTLLEITAWNLCLRAIEVVKQEGFEPCSLPSSDNAVAMTHALWVSKKTLRRLGENAQHRLSCRVSRLISDYYLMSAYPPYATMRPTSRVLYINADTLDQN